MHLTVNLLSSDFLHGLSYNFACVHRCFRIDLECVIHGIIAISEKMQSVSYMVLGCLRQVIFLRMGACHHIIVYVYMYTCTHISAYIQPSGDPALDSLKRLLGTQDVSPAYTRYYPYRIGLEHIICPRALDPCRHLFDAEGFAHPMLG